ncbi:2-oxoglutarate dehydrogenase E1 component,2-oxoglutarate dehydrogenase E1 component, N-terminal [Cinara cedri]|uniref:2-oxoglutarate dehydrogenase, mitochondrial n=1 Tax=Cinara cedri TaxID=506608 RepID=A0A5E4MZI0_9HEMI|nr:2-oxoglutarate dehydrogenase E1 component,2-oxoglutarate dehydrogenase E1 component, N-terminal [Cinara cedri]
MFNFGRSLFCRPTFARTVRKMCPAAAYSKSNKSPTSLPSPPPPTSPSYVEALYTSWLDDPNSVNASWNEFFKNSDAMEDKVPARNIGSAAATAATAAVPKNRSTDNQPILLSVIGAYVSRGHFAAMLDPLGRSKVFTDPKYRIEALYGGRASPISSADLNQTFPLPPATSIGGDNRDGALPLREIVERLERIYCRSVGVEYAFIDSVEQNQWIKERVEMPGEISALNNMEKRRLLTSLAKSTGFESYLARKWSSEKRFGLEGCEVLIPALNEILDESSYYGVDTVFLGMPHRGRLNVLANVCRKPLRTIFAQFHGLKAADHGSGDVKYHLGAHVKQTNERTGKPLTVALVANPSHLEAVDPVVLGKTRAEQFYRGDSNGDKVMSILLHGDSSISGQGVVYETFNMSGLPDYTAHGTVHVVVNNQVGFTAEPKISRTSNYCTDVAKVIGAPVFHVNADDPEAVIRVCKIAAKWRKTFKKDVVIDLVCYRRNGHNEGDEPMFTQPLMYKKIRSIMPVFEKFKDKLVVENVVTSDEAKKESDEYDRLCEEEFSASLKETHVKYGDWLDSPWPGFFKETTNLNVPKTGVTEDILLHVGNVFSSLPSAAGDQKFVVHKGIDRIFKGRQKMLADRVVDWALAEAMAFGSLLKDGTHVRLSGQDSERGTFSHRHHVLHDQLDGKTYRPLANLYPKQADYTVCNSFLSEYAVMGFELGYSITNPNALVCWEAQFGDFNNTAQCIIDQFISSGESKWMRQSGLVLLLPHSYEGMGPEHSSARLERFLQMCSEDADVLPEKNEHSVVKQLQDTNWIIANCSTPANYFHILRRQLALPFRKPLVIMSPKSLLRHPDAKSGLDEMTSDTGFLRVIPDNGPAASDPSGVKRLIFCSGKVYYDLIKAREERNLSGTVAVCRVEQISPFPFDLIGEECDKYQNADIMWTQEEPKNNGAWTYVQPRFYTALKGAKTISYAGRPAAASPATGNKVQHAAENHNILIKSFGGI